MLQKDILIHETVSVKDALKRLDKTAKKVLLVVDNENKLLGTITDGDIRRYILSGKNLSHDIKEVYNKNPIYIKKKDFSTEAVKKILIENKIELIPILDEDGKTIDFITWDQLFYGSKAEPLKTGKVNIPVVIMAGGRGERLDPFTRILPKALIPIGDEPIAEIIVEGFKKQGVSQFYLTLNHKSEIIESYFNGIEKDYKISYIKEKASLGTAGSLKLLEEKISDLFIVSNCDVIVKADFEDVLNFHKEQKALLTVLAPIQHYKIPYGVIDFKEGGEVEAIIEKPEYTLTINSGVYILCKESLEFIPDGLPFDMTDLIRALVENGRKVIMYPVNENDYIDIGQWEEYKKTVDKLHLFK